MAPRPPARPRRKGALPGGAGGLETGSTRTVGGAASPERGAEGCGAAGCGAEGCGADGCGAEGCGADGWGADGWGADAGADGWGWTVGGPASRVAPSSETGSATPGMLPPAEDSGSGEIRVACSPDSAPTPPVAVGVAGASAARAAAASSPALAQRSPGCLASARATTSSSASGSSPRTADGAGGSSFMCAHSLAASPSLGYGTCPVRTS